MTNPKQRASTNIHPALRLPVDKTSTSEHSHTHTNYCPLRIPGSPNGKQTHCGEPNTKSEPNEHGPPCFLGNPFRGTHLWKTWSFLSNKSTGELSGPPSLGRRPPGLRAELLHWSLKHTHPSKKQSPLKPKAPKYMFSVWSQKLLARELHCIVGRVTWTRTPTGIYTCQRSRKDQGLPQHPKVIPELGPPRGGQRGRAVPSSQSRNPSFGRWQCVITPQGFHWNTCCLSLTVHKQRRKD